MQVELGKYYRTRHGKVEGPARHNTAGTSNLYPFRAGSSSYTADGRYDMSRDGHPFDLVEEVERPADAEVQRPAEPAPRSAGRHHRKIYLSGPMKGYPGRNYPLFNMVSARLREAGHEVYNPAEFSADRPADAIFPIREAFAAYSKYICERADAIILLPGWENSKGANAERALADNCGVEIIQFDQLSITL